MAERDDGAILDDSEVALGPDPQARLGTGFADVQDDVTDEGIFYGADPLADSDGLDAQEATTAEDAGDDPPLDEPPLHEGAAATVVDAPADQAPVREEPADQEYEAEFEAEAWVDPLPEPLADDAEPEWDDAPVEADADLDLDADGIG
jgi:hypothetical protein